MCFGEPVNIFLSSLVRTLMYAGTVMTWRQRQ
jgi:hypothetical protein